MMLGVLAAIVLPLAGAMQIHVQIQSGGVTLIPAAHNAAVRIETDHSSTAPPHVETTRSGKTLSILVTGHPPVRPPFVQGASTGDAYEIVYPRNVRIEIYNMDGSVTIDGANAGVTIETNAGSIIASGISGDFDALADQGNITATLARSWNGPSLRMQSGNGSLHLTVPRALRAHVDASTDSGHVYNDLSRTNTGAKRPFVWLFTQKGDVYLSSSP